MQTAIRNAGKPRILVPAAEDRNWNVRLANSNAYYHFDDEESSKPRYTPYKHEAERFTLAEAEHFVAVLNRQYSAAHNAELFVIVSAGGEC